MTRRESFRQTRWRSLTAAPAGLVAAYVSEGDLLMIPVVAFGIKEAWKSPRRESGDFDPEQDTDFDSAPVCLIVEGAALEAAEAAINCVGVFALADLTADSRAALVAEYGRVEAEIAAARATRAARGRGPVTVSVTDGGGPHA